MGQSKLSRQEHVAEHREKVEVRFNRAGQAPIDGEYYIVRRITIPTKQFHHLFGVPFRHPTTESAQREANWQAASNPGDLFGIFHFTGITAKVEIAKPDEAPAVEDQKQAA